MGPSKDYLWSLQRHSMWSLHSLKAIGLPFQALKVDDISFAAGVRSANITSQHFFSEHYKHSCVLQGTAVSLAASASAHLGGSFFKKWSDDSDLYVSFFCGGIPRPLETKLFRQKIVHSKIRSHRQDFDFKDLISRRLFFFFKEDCDGFDAERVIRTYKIAAVKLGPKFVASHFRTIANHWCSSSRFGLRRRRCVFCNRFDDSCNDRIFHSLACPSLRLAFMRHHGLDSFTFEVREILMFNKASGIFDDGLEPSSETRALHCIYFVHLAFLMYNSCRHGSKCTDRLMTSIVKQTIKHSCKAWHMRVGILRNGF